MFSILNEESYSKIEIKDKIRIGIVSEFFTDHTIGKLYKDLIFSLDKNKFETFVFHSKKTSSGEIFNEFKKKEKSSRKRGSLLLLVKKNDGSSRFVTLNY